MLAGLHKGAQQKYKKFSVRRDELFLSNTPPTGAELEEVRLLRELAKDATMAFWAAIPKMDPVTLCMLSSSKFPLLPENTDTLSLAQTLGFSQREFDRTHFQCVRESKYGRCDQPHTHLPCDGKCDYCSQKKKFVEDWTRAHSV
jgi:hypothetical protein